MAAKITRHMLIGDVVEAYPQTMNVFMRFGLHCIGCAVSAWETIEQGAMAHGIADVDELVKALNDAVAERESNKAAKKKK